MDRSLSRIARLIGGAFAVVLLIAGCATNAPGAAVFGAPRPITSATPQASSDVVAGLELAIANELNAINASPNGGGSPEVLLELTALENPATLARAENFTRLLTLGANEATKREQVVFGLIGEVQGNSYIRGVTVGGRSFSAALIAVLDGVNSQLGSMASSVSSASLTDELHATIRSINASTRVYGLIEPMVHLALAGGDEIAEVNALATREQQLAADVAAAGTSDSHYASDLALLGDLSARLATARQIASSAVSSVLSLKASGFPGNKSTILAARTTLTQLRTPEGALGFAQGDEREIARDLGLAS
jgi:outer membrane murein-binding lipoprotein Lpp